MQKDISKWFLAWKTDVDLNVQIPFTLTGEDWVPKHQVQSSRTERIFSREWLTSTNKKSERNCLSLRLQWLMLDYIQTSLPNIVSEQKSPVFWHLKHHIQVQTNSSAFSSWRQKLTAKADQRKRGKEISNKVIFWLEYISLRLYLSKASVFLEITWSQIQWTWSFSSFWFLATEQSRFSHCP